MAQKFLTSIDLNKNEVQNVAMHKLAVAPSTPTLGQFYFNTVNNRAYCWSGSKWVGMDAVDSTMTGADIVTAINGSAGVIDLDNLAASVGSAVTNNHTHSNKAVLDATTASFTTADETKLDGIAAGAQVNNISAINATDLTDAGDTTLHYHAADRNRANHTGTQSADTLTDGTTNKAYTATEKTKLAGIEAGAEVNNISYVNATDLTDGGDSTLHYHSADRNRENHTGTQSADTITDGTTNKAYTATEKTKLAGIEAGAQVNTVTSVAGKTGVVTLAKGDVGLGNVTNDAQVKKLASSTNGKIPTWNGTTGDALNDGYSVETSLAGSSSAIPRADAVKAYVDALLSANDAMVYKGTLGTGGTVTALPTTHSAGWAYKVITAGTYAGIVCEVGDLIIAVIDRAGTGNINSDWTVVQTNTDGAVIGPASATDGNFPLFNGATGKLIKNSAYGPSSFAGSGHTHAGVYQPVDGDLTAIAALAGTSGFLKKTAADTWELDTTVVRKYAANVGDNSSTSIVVTHNLNTQDVTVMLREVASPYAVVMTDIEITSVNTITLKFAAAPTSGQYRVIVTG